MVYVLLRESWEGLSEIFFVTHVILEALIDNMLWIIK